MTEEGGGGQSCHIIIVCIHDIVVNKNAELEIRALWQVSYLY